MKLFKNELKEWKSLLAKARKHKIKIKRIGPANIIFEKDVYAQLGTGRATSIMDAKIKIKKRNLKRKKRKKK